MLRLAIAAFAIGLVLPAMAQEEFLGIPGPITFEATEFAFAWSSHPDETYFKQEYLPAGQSLDAYAEMFIIEAVTTGATPQSAASGMIAGLDKRRADDPVVNYDMIENAATGEIILDFLVSDTSSGAIVVEWNAYRYAPLGDGVALYAISRRGYGDEASTFIGGLKDWRQPSISALAQMDVPAIALPD